MQDWLAASARANPQKVALISDSHTWTYATLDWQVSETAARLAAVGVEHGQHVGVLLPNCVEYVLLVHALARLGAVLVPLNVRLTPDELNWQAQWADCVVVICNEDTAPKLAEPHAAVSVIRVDGIVGAGLRPAPTAPRPTLHADEAEFDLARVQSIVFTSGTTGRPKGAQITFGSHFYSAAASSWRIGVVPEDRWLLVMPLYHVGGMSIVFRSALYGTAVVLHDGFDVKRVWRALETEGITLISVVPTMLHRLLEAHPKRAFPASVRLALLGGAAASTQLIARCAERNIPLATTYGLTEACSQVATMLPDEVRGKPGSVGKPLLFTTVRIADEGGDDLPAGEYGEIVVSGPTLMAGYYQQPDEHALRDGELFTGDLGYLDEDGDLWIVQRRNDLILSGGENVYPVEVESVLRQHPAVAEAAVVGIPNEEWGQQVAAAVVLKQGSGADANELDEFCRQRLAGYQCPRRYAFVTELPQTASGKVSRRLVADLMASA
jgi:O-succinylbenzoic acid--CoA ligase